MPTRYGTSKTAPKSRRSRHSGGESDRGASGYAARAAFDFNAALDSVERSAPLTSARNSELAREPLHSWVRAVAARVWAGRMTWVQGRAVLASACAAGGIPLRSSAHVIAAFARRKFWPAR